MGVTAKGKEVPGPVEGRRVRTEGTAGREDECGEQTGCRQRKVPCGLRATERHTLPFVLVSSKIPDTLKLLGWGLIQRRARV